MAFVLRFTDKGVAAAVATSSLGTETGAHVHLVPSLNVHSRRVRHTQVPAARCPLFSALVMCLPSHSLVSAF